MPINRDEFEKTIRLPYQYSGEQTLIMGEIIGAMSESIHSPFVYLPFYSDLMEVVRNLGFVVFCANIVKPSYFECYDEIPAFDVMYFGTPTIVNDRPLFEGWDSEWSKSLERLFVRNLCERAERKKYKKIISGLGSGDISVEERISDMGGGKVITYKDFGDFQDWVIERIL